MPDDIDLTKPAVTFTGTSPVEERHIDFLLEEEFACNPEFLRFFVAEAARHVAIGNASSRMLPAPSEASYCRVVRSVTTQDGETDVLVVYASAEPDCRRVAILIEDKIRAGFQEKQAARYRARGLKGIGRTWDVFWTCLVAPRKYAPKNLDFDARVSLEALRDFFTEASRRSSFKASVFAEAIAISSRSGVQIVHTGITEWRAAYSATAEARFGSEVQWDRPRPAYDRDTWFCFRSALLPRGAVITHKAEMGAVHLSLPRLAAERLRAATQRSGIQTNPQIIQTNKSASYLLPVTRINFLLPFQESRAAVEEAFERVSDLMTFWRSHGATILAKLEESEDLSSEILTRAPVVSRAAGEQTHPSFLRYSPR